MDNKKLVNKYKPKETLKTKEYKQIYHVINVEKGLHLGSFSSFNKAVKERKKQEERTFGQIMVVIETKSK